MDGKIFVKTSPSGAPVRFYCEEDLDDLSVSGIQSNAEQKKGLWTGLLREGTLKIGLFFKYIIGNLLVLFCFGAFNCKYEGESMRTVYFYFKNRFLNA